MRKPLDPAKSGVSLGLARPCDARRIAAISRELIEAGLRWSWRPERVVQQIKDRNSIVLTARTKGCLAGFAIMHFRDETAHLNLLAVQPSYQRSGIARSMLSWLEKSAITAGIFEIYLEVRANNRKARTFYTSQGYRDERLIPRYYDRREPALRMVHRLAQGCNNEPS